MNDRCPDGGNADHRRLSPRSAVAVREMLTVLDGASGVLSRFANCDIDCACRLSALPTA